MTDDPEQEFRRQLRRAPASPISPRGAYVASVILVLFGIATSVTALSGPMRWSGLIIVLLGILLAVRTRWATPRR